MNIHKCLDTWIDLTHVCAVSEVEDQGFGEGAAEFHISFLFRDNRISIFGEGDLVKESHVGLLKAWMGDIDTQTSNE